MSSDTIAYRDGDIRYPTGQATARLTYCFVLREGSRAANEAKAKAVINALKGRRGDLADSDLPGKVYKNAVFESVEPLEYVSRSFAAAYMTVVFAADPEPEPAGAVNECVLKFAARGIVRIYAYSNAYFVVTDNNGTKIIPDTQKTITAPYTYRLSVISENVPAIREGASTSEQGERDLTPDVPFTLPDTGNRMIKVTHSGYGWYELWHDTREVSP